MEMNCLQNLPEMLQKIVLFRHSAGTSCQKWSDFMGKYKKSGYDTTYHRIIHL